MNAQTWTAPTAEQRAAAIEIVDAIIDALASQRGVHAETAVAAAARMSGTFAFRSFGLPVTNIEPGSPVFSDAANEHGPLLVRTVTTEAIALGIDESNLRSADPIADDHRPHLSLVETQRLLDVPLKSIVEQHSLSSQQSAHACAIAAGRLMHMCAQVLDPRIAFSLVVQGLVEGSKTAPIC